MFALNTYSYIHRATAAACLRNWAGRGLTLFEVMVYPGHFWPQDLSTADRRAWRRFVDENGLRLCSLNMPNIDLNIAAADPLVRRYSVDHLLRVIALAGEIGAEAVVIGPGKPNPLSPAPEEQLRGWMQAAMDRLVPAAAAAERVLAIENMPFAFLPGAAQIAEAARDYPAATVRLVYDIANAAFVAEPLDQGFRAVRERLHLVHLSDTDRTVYRHGPVGSGSVDFQAAAAAARDAGYTGPSVLEIITEAPDREIAESIGELERMGWPITARSRP